MLRELATSIRLLPELMTNSPASARNLGVDFCRLDRHSFSYERVSHNIMTAQRLQDFL